MTVKSLVDVGSTTYVECALCGNRIRVPENNNHFLHICIDCREKQAQIEGDYKQEFFNYYMGIPTSVSGTVGRVHTMQEMNKEEYYARMKNLLEERSKIKNNNDFTPEDLPI